MNNQLTLPPLPERLACKFPPLTVRNSGYVCLQQIEDGHDGTLFVIEELRHVPFSVKRTYLITNFHSQTSMRGHHAHKTLIQAIFCIRGKFRLGLDDGRNRQDLILDDPQIGVILGPGLWHTMNEFSPDAILFVAASDYYDESDYIRDYQEFLDWINERQETGP